MDALVATRLLLLRKRSPPLGGNLVFDIKKRKDLSGSTVRGLITELLELPMDARVYCCGDNNMYLHVETDNSAVCLDHSDLEECYQ